MRRAVYQVQVARFEGRQERKEEKVEKKSSIAPSIDEESAEPSASDGAKTAEELSAAAPAESVPADVSSMNRANSKKDDANATDDTHNTDEGAPGLADVARPGLDPSRPKPQPKPPIADEAAARRREQRLYADLEVQKLADLYPTTATKRFCRCLRSSNSPLPIHSKAARDRNFWKASSPNSAKSCKR